MKSTEVSGNLLSVVLVKSMYDESDFSFYQITGGHNGIRMFHLSRKIPYRH